MTAARPTSDGGACAGATAPSTVWCVLYLEVCSVVYVLEDGSEVDLDLGNYERFLDVTLASNHNITSGKIFDQVIKRERTGESAGSAARAQTSCEGRPALRVCGSGLGHFQV